MVTACNFGACSFALSLHRGDAGCTWDLFGTSTLHELHYKVDTRTALVNDEETALLGLGGLLGRP